MTEKKAHKRKPGPKLPKPDMVRLQLANKFMKGPKPPPLGPYKALTRACVLFPNCLPATLEVALRKVPVGWSVSVHLKGPVRQEWKRTLSRLRKALASNAAELHLDYDTSWIFGAPDHDAAVVEYNMQEDDKDDDP